jgi:hypothetical protein
VNFFHFFITSFHVVWCHYVIEFLKHQDILLCEIVALHHNLEVVYNGFQAFFSAQYYQSKYRVCGFFFFFEGRSSVEMLT